MKRVSLSAAGDGCIAKVTSTKEAHLFIHIEKKNFIGYIFDLMSQTVYFSILDDRKMKNPK